MYVRDESLIAGRAVSVDEIACEFELSRLQAYQVVGVLTEQQEIRQSGDMLELAPSRKPCWIK